MRRIATAPLWVPGRGKLDASGIDRVALVENLRGARRHLIVVLLGSTISWISISTAVGFVGSAATALYLMVQREKSQLHWHLAALLLAIALWTGGGLLRLDASTPSELEAALRVLFLGATVAPGIYLLLAAHYARLGLAEEWPSAAFLVLLPAVFFYTAFLTNPFHHLFFATLPPVGPPVGVPFAWGGPIYWVASAWAFLCCAVALALYGRAALRFVGARERARATLLAVAALAPLSIGSMYLFGLVSPQQDPIPPSVAISALLIVVAVVRYRAFEPLPLVRRDVIEHMRDGVLLADSDGLVLDANGAAERLLGAPAGVLRARPLLRTLELLERPQDRGAIAAVLARMRDERLSQCLDLQTPDDRRIELHASPVRGRDGRPAGCFVELHDRTERFRYERALRQRQKLETVGTLIAGVAHEVNNPLTFVRASLMHLRHVSEGLLKRFDAEQVAELRDVPGLVDEALEGVERIVCIVDGMRRFSRMPDGRPAAVDVNRVASDAVRLAGFHGSRDVIVLPRLGRDLPFVDGSPERLVQVLLNLLVNAKQALRGRPGGRVVVETIRRGDHVQLRVADNGPGIPVAIRHRLFDPFFTTKGPDEGTGLGLSIAFDIVREHGGAIDVVSEEGRGALFVVRLPIARSGSIDVA